MTRCTATGALMTEQMATMPGVTLPCDLEQGHQGAHQVTLTWFDPTVQELAEVLDPDEAFDLEVDIAPAEVIESVETIPVARPRCSVCGRETVPDPLSTNGVRHLNAGVHNGHAARV